MSRKPERESITKRQKLQTELLTFFFKIVHSGAYVIYNTFLAFNVCYPSL